MDAAPKTDFQIGPCLSHPLLQAVALITFLQFPVLAGLPSLARGVLVWGWAQ